jgi:hypothetical protein
MKRMMILLGSVATLIALTLPSSALGDTATLSAPTLGSVSQGTLFAVDVSISNAVDLSAYQLDLIFNPAVVQATGAIVEGSFFQSGGGFIPGTVDNTLGQIIFNADTLLGPGSGLSGGGTLIEFFFTASAPGTSLLTIQNEILLDSTGAQITDSTQDGSVTVTGGGPVPTPESGSLLLLASALGTFGLFAISKRVRNIN